MVDQFLVNKEQTGATLTAIKDWLTLWKENHAELVKTIKVSPILKEIESLSKDLASSAEVGLQTLDYIEKGEKPEEEWIKAKRELLEKAKEPRGQTELMIIPAIEKLILDLN